MENKYKVRFVPLGGIVDVTKNMYLYELYDNGELKDILIVDCGVGFPTDDNKESNYTVPDISYLKDKTDKIRGILFTHGHEDHISALRFYYHELGSPKVYASKITALFLQDKCKEMGIKLSVEVIEYKKEYSFGMFKASYIHVTHSIPDTTHIFIKSPIGNFYHGSDFKFDLTPVYGKPPDFYSITKAGNEGVLCLLSDALGTENEGLTTSEAVVGKTFEDEMRITQGKFFMTTFSSNISRIRQCCEAAILLGRKICFVGRSMKQNTKLAMQNNYLPIPNNCIIDDFEVMKNKPNKICLIVAGSQGQEESALSKIADNMHKTIRFAKGDKILFSSDPIPGQERAVYKLIEKICQLNTDVVYTDIHSDLHASGHGNKEDLKFLIRFTNPKFLLPIGGTIRHQRQYAKLAESLDISEDRVILLKDGETYWFEKDKANKGQKIDLREIYVTTTDTGETFIQKQEDLDSKN